MIPSVGRERALEMNPSTNPRPADGRRPVDDDEKSSRRPILFFRFRRRRSTANSMRIDFAGRLISAPGEDSGEADRRVGLGRRMLMPDMFQDLLGAEQGLRGELAGLAVKQPGVVALDLRLPGDEGLWRLLVRPRRRRGRVGHRFRLKYGGILYYLLKNCFLSFHVLGFLFKQIVVLQVHKKEPSRGELPACNLVQKRVVPTGSHSPCNEHL